MQHQVGEEIHNHPQEENTKTNQQTISLGLLLTDQTIHPDIFCSDMSFLFLSNLNFQILNSAFKKGGRWGGIRIIFNGF